MSRSSRRLAFVTLVVCAAGSLALAAMPSAAAADDTGVGQTTGPTPPSSAAPATDPEEKAWGVELTPFLWVAGLNGQVGLGSAVEPLDMGFIDILESLKGTAMAELSLRYRRIGVWADGIWLRMDTSQASSLPFIDELTLTLNSAFGTGAGFFRFEPTRGLYLDPYVGARWWRIKTELEATGSCGACPFGGEAVVSWADPVFGLRVSYDITDRWFVRGLGDVGGGVSKLQWQFNGTTGYRFTRWLSVDAGYRITDVKYEQDGFLFDMTVSGFVMGLGFRY